MTLEESINLKKGGHFEPQTVSFPKVYPQCTPPAVNDFNLGVPKKPTPDDYNKMSLSDMENFNKVKYMDSIHAADAIAKQYDRGTKLNAIAKVDGKTKFASRYNVKL